MHMTSFRSEAIYSSVLKRDRRAVAITVRQFFPGRVVLSLRQVLTTSPKSVEITRLLRAWSGGDEAAFERLAPAVYAELRLIARGYMLHERQGHTLQATALVHEAYLRLIDLQDVGWQDRAHFFAVSAQMMRRILVDRARARVTGKRGGVGARLQLDEILEVGSWRA